MVFKLLAATALMTGAAPGLSMCATQPAALEEEAEAEVYQTGPDGLPVRSAPSSGAVETGAIPEAALE